MHSANDPSMVSVAIFDWNTAAELTRSLSSLVMQTHCNWEGVVFATCEQAVVAEAVLATYQDERIRMARLGRDVPGVELARVLDESQGGLVAFLRRGDFWQWSNLSAKVAMLRNEKDRSAACMSSIYVYGPRSGTSYSVSRRNAATAPRRALWCQHFPTALVVKRAELERHASGGCRDIPAAVDRVVATPTTKWLGANLACSNHGPPYDLVAAIRASNFPKRNGLGDLLCALDATVLWARSPFIVRGYLDLTARLRRRL